MFTKLSLIVVLNFACILLINAYQVNNNPFHRAEYLDPDGKYLLDWEVNWRKKAVFFNITVETLHWVAFGLSNKGIPTGADLIVGGVKRNGRSYFSDRHISPGIDMPILDKHQDWILHSASESATHTYLTFSRAFDTCDVEDYAITENKISLIWAYGQSDDENGNDPMTKGTYSIHLIDPDYSPQIDRDISGEPSLITVNRNENIPRTTRLWTMEKKIVLPKNDTSYVCSLHKAPQLYKKHHFIGYDVAFGNAESEKGAHHLIIYRCHPPDGSSAREIFEPHLGNPGEPCYAVKDSRRTGRSIPMQYCTEYFTTWGIGGGQFWLPNNIGFAFGKSPNEYYMMEVHFDNPERRDGIQLEIRMDVFYTSRLRPNEGGLMGMATTIPGLPEALLLPPNSEDFRILAHCSPDCTKEMYPKEGVTISVVGLHSHNAGVGMRLRHFRNERELPWILFDDNYDNFFQEIRSLRKEVIVMQGDQLTLECHYTNNGTVVGGYSTRQEMCVAWIFYYGGDKEFSTCHSGSDSEEARYDFLGVRNVSWIESELEWVVQSPVELAGHRVSEVSDKFVNWNSERRRKWQRFNDVNPQVGGCNRHSRAQSSKEDIRGAVTYPFAAIPYKPPSGNCRYH